jgi:hypothetical protein
VPDPGKLDALAAAGFVLRETCASCIFSTGGAGWLRCTKITHTHAKHGERSDTGVPANGWCPSWQHDPDPSGAPAPGYERFIEKRA